MAISAVSEVIGLIPEEKNTFKVTPTFKVTKPRGSGNLEGVVLKTKRTESGDSILLLKLTKLTKPKLMKKNVLQIYDSLHFQTINLS